MSTTPWMTTSQLVRSIKRKIMMPLSQNTFSEQDIIDFLNEEMMISQVPSVLSFHEDYYVAAKPTPILPNISRYPIPDRAIGMKLRDLFWADQSGTLFEMARISSEDKAFFSRNIGANQAIHKYYLEGNEIVLTPENTTNITGTLMFYYFQRPNQLVPDERAAISQSFVKTVTLTNSAIVAGDTITIGSLLFTAVSSSPGPLEFLIDISSAATASNLNSAINTDGTYSSTVSSNILTIQYNSLDVILSTSNSSALAIQQTQGIRFDQVPANITNGSIVDLLQTNSGHRILNIDVKLANNAISSDTINFNAADIPVTFKIGDYVCSQNESIIPYLPTDLHTGLAERTGARILAAIGDQAGLQSANQKIQEIELRQGTILDNRVEGSPTKITGRHSLLHYLGMGNRRRM